MKKTGIVCDNYKIKKFREDLKAAGFEKINEFSFTEDTSVLTLEVEDEAQVKEVGKICALVELHFKQGN